ncbi:MAG TPA: hypothetical protein P5244_13055, partial [Syntrophales bacterium]|nr:hypothetical protein [Syntrophales bacterium]
MRRMTEIFWRADARGWFRSVDASGGRLDETIDTYDQAFGLLPLAWEYRVTGDPEIQATRRAHARGPRTFCPGSDGRWIPRVTRGRGGAPTR